MVELLSGGGRNTVTQNTDLQKKVIILQLIICCPVECAVNEMSMVRFPKFELG